MNKKAFTLMELLASIIILGIIFAIAVPSITNILRDAKTDELEIQEGYILEAGINYFVDQMTGNNMTFDLYETKSVALQTLIDEGYIDEIYHPGSNNLCTDASVTIGYGGGRRYDYSVILNCEDYSTSKDNEHFIIENYKLLKATKAYFTATGFPTSGNSSSVTLSTLESGGYITSIDDPISGNNCTGKVIVVNNNGTIEYKSGVICDNFLRVEAWDLLGGNGYFSSDSNSDGLADGWSSWESTNFELDTIEKIQSFNATSQWGQIMHPLTITLNHIFYLSGRVKSASPVVLIADNTTYSNIMADYTDVGNYQRISDRDILNNGTSINVIVEDNETTNWDTIYAKELFFLDLTQIYGAGNEPSLEQMDIIIENSGY